MIKLYEALGALGDGRIQVQGDRATVWSSSRKKYYDVRYDATTRAIMANDNGSYWQGYLGYPSICYMLAAGLVVYPRELEGELAGIQWKELNVANKNDWAKTESAVRAMIESRHPGHDFVRFDETMTALMDAVMALGLARLGAGPNLRPATSRHRLR